MESERSKAAARRHSYRHRICGIESNGSDCHVSRHESTARSCRSAHAWSCVAKCEATESAVATCGTGRQEHRQFDLSFAASEGGAAHGTRSHVPEFVYLVEV